MTTTHRRFDVHLDNNLTNEIHKEAERLKVSPELFVVDALKLYIRMVRLSRQGFSVGASLSPSTIPFIQ